MNDNEKLLTAAKNAFWAQLRHGYPLDENGKTTYMLDENNLDVVREICHWMVDAPCQTLHHRCGIGLAGPKGTGKTDMMRALSRTVIEGFRIISAVELVLEYNRSSRNEADNGGDKVIMKWGKLGYDICIDDLGEERMGSHFGKETDVVAEIIALRYVLWKQRGIRTHITTNITTNEAMLERYGQRTHDRIIEMNKMLPLVGASRRGTTEPSEHAQAPLFVLPEVSEVLSSEAAAVHFERIKRTVADAAKEITVTKVIQRPAPSDRDTDLTRFAARIMDLDVPMLQELKARYAVDPNSAPYIEIIDKAIAELNGVEV